MRPKTARAAAVAELVAAGRLSSAVAGEIVRNGRVGDTAWHRVRPLFEEHQQERLTQRQEGEVMAPASPELHEERFEDLGVGPGGSDYTGYLYELRIHGRAFGLRLYDDTSDLVSFHDVGRVGGERGRFRGGVPYADPVFARAVAHLIERLGVTRVEVLTSDPEHPDVAYAPVDLSRLRT